MLEYLIELVGTFIFLTIIIIFGNPFIIGLTLAAMIALGGKISGGHFNPAVSFMMFLNKKIDLKKLILYIMAQILAGVCAYLYYKNTV